MGCGASDIPNLKYESPDEAVFIPTGKKSGDMCVIVNPLFATPHAHGETDTQTDAQTNKHIDTQTNTHRQKDKLTDSQTK
jgi:hypothetical protein